MYKKNHHKTHTPSARITGILALLLIAAIVAIPLVNIIVDIGTAATEAYTATQLRIETKMNEDTMPTTVTNTTTATINEADQAAIMGYIPEPYLMKDASGSVRGEYCVDGTMRYKEDEKFTDFLRQTGGDSAIGTNLITVLKTGCLDVGILTDCHSEPAEELDNMDGYYFQNRKITIFYTSDTDHHDLVKLVEKLTKILNWENCTIQIVSPTARIDDEPVYATGYDNYGNKIEYNGYMEPRELLAMAHTTVVTETVEPATQNMTIEETRIDWNGWMNRTMETFRPFIPMMVLCIFLMGFLLIICKRIYRIAMLADDSCSCEGTDGDTGCKCCKCCCKCTCCEGCFFKRFCRKCRCCSDTCAASAPRVASAASAVPAAYTAPATVIHRYEHHYYVHDGEAARSTEDVSCAALVVDGAHSMADRSRYSEAVCDLADDAPRIYLFDNEDCKELATITDISTYPCVTASDFNRMLCEMHARGHRHLNLVTRNLSDIGEFYSYMTFDSINLWVPGDVEIRREELEKLNALLTGGNHCEICYMEENT